MSPSIGTHESGLTSSEVGFSHPTGVPHAQSEIESRFFVVALASVWASAGERQED
jgi:hypothetical protein